MQIDNVVSDNEPTEVPSKDSVKYETYSRTMSQLKKSQDEAKGLKDRLDALELKDNQAEESRLNEQGEFKKLLELERDKNTKAEQKITDHERTMLNAHKLSAFRQKLPGKLKNNAYYDFVDTDNIVIDPTTGAVDEGALDQVVNGFLTEHAALIESEGKTTLPGNAPQNPTGRLGYDEWLVLSLGEKKKRFQEMRRNDKNK